MRPSRRIPSSLSGNSQVPPTMGGDASTTAHRVLVVDDEPNIVDVVSMALRFQGFEVETAGTGGRRSRPSAAFRPHLMVLDVMLPDMEGFEVARRLRRRARPTCRSSSSPRATRPRTRSAASRIGGDDYVTKPFSLEELVARIRTILRRTGQAAPSRSRLVFEDLELDEDTREVTRGGRADRADRHRVPAAALPDAQPAPRADARARSSTTCGTTTSAATPACSRPTSATCARSSTRTARR